MDPKEIKLESGAVLKIMAAPFNDSFDLFQALLVELQKVELSAGKEMGSLYKDLFCIGYSSPVIEACLWKCLGRCTYNSGGGDLKIDKDTFEPVECREDFLEVCMEVAKENVTPFGKRLYAQYEAILKKMAKSPA